MARFAIEGVGTWSAYKQGGYDGEPFAMNGEARHSGSC